MARVLMINAGAEGHINPTLGLVKELIGRHEKVIYVATEQFRDPIERIGAKVITYDADKFLEIFLSEGENPWARASGLLRTADVVIPSVLEQTKGEQFDYIIHDSMFGCGYLLAQILGLPAINSCASFAIRKNSFDSREYRRSLRYPADVIELAQQEFQQLVIQMQDKYNVQIGSPYEIFCNPAPLNIVYTSKHFQPGGESFDRSYKFVGPSVVPPSNDEFDWSHVDADKLIYISLGTVFNQAVDFYKLCFEAFENTKYTVMLSVGRQTQIAELGDIPENFIVRNHMPQLEILQHAKLFITHGGMNSTSEGLYYGVPLIVLPQSADQPIIAQRVAEVGAGVQLNKEGLMAGVLLETAECVLKDVTFRKTCEEIGNSFRAAGGYREAVEEIFVYKRSLGIEG